MKRAVLLALCACVSSPATAPQPASVAPSRVAAGSTTLVTITGRDFLAAVFTNFQRQRNSTLEASFSAALVAGDGTEVALEAVSFVDSETLTAEVPASAPRGLYDVKVIGPYGEGVATGGLRVVTSAESVAAFQFDAIDPQRAGVPFALGLTAVDEVGENVEGFDGLAFVSVPGVAMPVSVGPFALGRGRAFVTVAAPVMGVRLVAADLLGHTGTSDAFDVTAGEAARVAFVEAPERMTAGDCAGPFTVEVQDTFGNAAAASAASMFAMAVIPPEGGELFSDASCGSAASSGMLQGRASFFVRSTKAGRPQVRVVPEAWPSAAREVDVDAGVAAGLMIASAPQVLAAGMCSQPVVVRARDAFGNPAPVPAAVPLEVAATPAVGVTLHEDSACAAALNVFELAAGGVEARFFFRSAVPAMLELSVDGGTLGAAVQGEEVTP